MSDFRSQTGANTVTVGRYVRAWPLPAPSDAAITISRFQGGPPGRTRRRLGALAFAPAAAPATAGPAPVGWRYKRKTLGPRSTGKVPGPRRDLTREPSR